MNKKFYFMCDVKKGTNDLNGDLASLVGVFENLDLEPEIVARRPVSRNVENVEIICHWYDSAADKFNALSLQDRFYFETVEDFLAECEKHDR